MQIERKVQLATVFSGIGAIEYAFRRLNLDYDLVFACDNDRYVRRSYFTNYRPDRWYDDIRDIDGTEFRREVDLFVGGSPCQSFSIAGERDGLSDERGLLIMEFARLVREIDPRFFIYENVANIMRTRDGRDWHVIRDTLGSLDYRIKVGILDSQDFGIPQQRNRLFIIGSRDHEDIYLPERENHRQISLHDLLQNREEENYLGFRNYGEEFGLIGDYYLRSPEKVPENYYLSENMKNYVLSPGTKTYHAKPETDLPVARTLLKTMHKMHRAGIDNYITDNNGIRKLTPRECLRLMGFDDRFDIAVSDTQMYMQCGNSIVVDVLMYITVCLPIWDENIQVDRLGKKGEEIPFVIQTGLDDFF